MDKKLKKDFQKKIIRNRDAPEKNMDSKLVHSDDYTNKIIKTKDRFGDKISEKESKLIHENVLAKAVSYTHLTLPTTQQLCRSRGSPYQ